jgi:hypothetical protein
VSDLSDLETGIFQRSRIDLQEESDVEVFQRFGIDIPPSDVQRNERNRKFWKEMKRQVEEQDKQASRMTPLTLFLDSAKRLEVMQYLKESPKQFKIDLEQVLTGSPGESPLRSRILSTLECLQLEDYLACPEGRKNSKRLDYLHLDGFVQPTRQKPRHGRKYSS